MLPFGPHRPAARLTGENPMALERTLSIIKPAAVAKNVVGEIYTRFETAGLKVAAAKMKHLSRKEADGFYAVHRERQFFNGLGALMKRAPGMRQEGRGGGKEGGGSSGSRGWG